MVGRKLRDIGVTKEQIPNYYSVKESVFPFIKFPGVDPILGPEMKSTGEVMGVGVNFGEAFAKGQLGAGERLPRTGKVFISVREVDKGRALNVARSLLDLGFSLVATRGTAEKIKQAGLTCEMVYKGNEGRPDIVDMIKNDEIDLIINTTEGRQTIADSYTIRRSALQHKVPYTTTVAGGEAICIALQQKDNTKVKSLQELHQELVA